MARIGHLVLLVAAAAVTASAQLLGNEVDSSLSLNGKPSQPMSVYTFFKRVMREVTPVESLPFLDQLETNFRTIVGHLDKTQNFQYNKGVIEQLKPRENITSTQRETGEIFTDWVEKILDVAYDWAKNNESEHYQVLAADFKDARDWIHGLSKFNDRFTEQHVQVIGDFYRAYSTRSDWGSGKASPASMYEAFKNHVSLKAAEESETDVVPARVRRSAAMVMLDDDAEFRGVFSKPRNETGFWGWLKTLMDYHEDAVVIYNRAQQSLWVPKMLISFIAPPIKFVWTGVDLGYCLHEEIYELFFAQETEERWWDILLCGMEIFGVIPGGGAVKFAARILIRLLKFKLGIHTVPWWASGPASYIAGWFGYGGSTAVATTTVAAIIQAVTTTPMPLTTTTKEYHFGSATTTTMKPFEIIGAW